MSFKNPLHCSILIYLLIISLIIYLKPKMIFTKNGKIKSWGLSDNKTIYPLGLVVLVIAILCYFFISYYFVLEDLNISKKIKF